ncbi:hypothetical protein EJB05_40113 [Eragrostis curvula]|uniref:Myb-like domain-containing protein n=1 Tax=Eragrostis curvula TaxID=38414 RepID=A0A5J9TYT5_9POAL|nr:hypothetical protein EJB05_40113 [Eragrostis curvula]
MAADSSMGFHQGITASMYNHHMLSFQSNSDVGMGGGGGVTGGMVMAPRSVSGSSSTAGPFLSSNTGVISNSSGVGPSRSSSGDVFGSSGTPKYKFVTGSPSDWSDRELSILKEGLVRYAREPNIMKYIKIAAMLPNRTIRDVALRCWWSTVNILVQDTYAGLILQYGKDRRKKPDGFYSGKKLREMKHLLEENNQLLNQIAANIGTLKAEDNTNLFLQTSNNIKTILNRMSETPGIMGQMPPLPVPVNEDNLNSLLQLNRMVRAHSQLAIGEADNICMSRRIIRHNKNISPYKARATELMYHILRERKIGGHMTGASPVLLTCCEKCLHVVKVLLTDCRKSHRAFQRVFFPVI